MGYGQGIASKHGQMDREKFNVGSNTIYWKPKAQLKSNYVKSIMVSPINALVREKANWKEKGEETQKHFGATNLLNQRCWSYRNRLVIGYAKSLICTRDQVKLCSKLVKTCTPLKFWMFNYNRDNLISGIAIKHFSSPPKIL